MAEAKGLPVAMLFESSKEEYFAAADLVIVELVNEGRPFTADDFRARMATEPRSSKWPGLAFNMAARQGLIKKSGYRESTTPSRNSGVIAIWVPKKGDRA